MDRILHSFQLKSLSKQASQISVELLCRSQMRRFDLQVRCPSQVANEAPDASAGSLREQADVLGGFAPSVAQLPLVRPEVKHTEIWPCSRWTWTEPGFWSWPVLPVLLGKGVDCPLKFPVPIRYLILAFWTFELSLQLTNMAWRALAECISIPSDRRINLRCQRTWC